MSDPYLLDLPAVVAFSGGRTSGFMLRHILDAHGGQPEDLVVSFQNTGLEHPTTYEFVRECGERWGVDVTWLEYDLDGAGEPTYRIVDFESAARNGEPFDKLIKKKGFLPNPVSRLCTFELKAATLTRYLTDLGHKEEGITLAMGLRHDEPRRAMRAAGHRAWQEAVAPMYYAKHTEEDVLEWWSQQEFDLGLPLRGNMAGNCVGCFLKSRGKIEILMEEMPEHFDWWEKAEEAELPKAKESATRFRLDRPSYAQMVKTVREQGRLFGPDDEDTIPCMCTD